MLAVTLYSILKLVHIASAIVAVGANLTYFVWLQRAKRAAAAEQRFALEGVGAVDRFLANPAYIVLPITGIWMVLDAGYSFGTLWIALGLGLYVLVAGLAGALFTPALKRQLELVGTSGLESPDYAAAVKRTQLTGVITMAPIAIILYLMVVKPT